MTWHHHGKIGDEPMVELNGLDLHIVNRIGASFRDGYPAKCSPLMTSVRHARWLSS
jgi:gentisate 1,2-dioxygenase